jgi:hypothetical protein
VAGLKQTKDAISFWMLTLDEEVMDRGIIQFDDNKFEKKFKLDRKSWILAESEKRLGLNHVVYYCHEEDGTCALEAVTSMLPLKFRDDCVSISKVSCLQTVPLN